MAKQWKGTVDRGIRRVLVGDKQRYLVQFGPRGNRRSKVCKTLEEAVALKTAWLAHGIPAKGSEKTPPADETPSTVEDGLAQYEMILLRRGKNAESARRGSRQVLRAIERVWVEFARKPLHVVTVDDVREFVQRRRAAKIADSTIGRDFNGLRAMLKITRPDLKIPAEVKPPDDLTRVRLLTEEQQQAIFPELEEQFGLIFARIARLALLTTMRLTEVSTLRREMIHLPARVILLKRQKGGAPRAVRLSDEAIELLTRQLASHDADLVFPNPRTGRPYSRVHISRTWRLACRACGITNFRFHDTRHHLPTLAATEGRASDRQLQTLLGVKSPRMVGRYAHVLDPALDGLVNLASRVAQ